MNSLNSSGFSVIDGLIIFVYLSTLMGIGFYFSRKQKTLDDYFKSGKQLGWLSVGISLMAALNSGLDYINTPAVVFGIGMITVMSFISWIPLYPWVTRVTIPIYRRLDVFSAYESGTQPKETFYDGYVVNAVMDAAYLSAKTKRWEPIILEEWRGDDIDSEGTAVLEDYDGQYYLIKEELLPSGDKKVILKDKKTGKIVQR